MPRSDLGLHCLTAFLFDIFIYLFSVVMAAGSGGGERRGAGGLEINVVNRIYCINENT